MLILFHDYISVLLEDMFTTVMQMQIQTVLEYNRDLDLTNHFF